MISVGLVAILTDRKVISLRSVALAAIVILLIWPENIVSISFQLSFAATTALVAFYERWNDISQNRLLNLYGYNVPRPIKALFAIGLTSLVAQLGVLPFALYHFQEISLVALLTNILVLPIISFVVMPILLIVLVLSGLGIIGLVAPVLELSLNVVLNIANFMGYVSWATMQTHQLYDWAMLLLVLALFGTILIKNLKALIPLFVIFIFVGVFGFKEPASLLVARNASVLAFYQSGKMYVPQKTRRESFRLSAWQRYWAVSDGNIIEVAKNCDDSACMYKPRPGLTLLLVQTLDAVRYGCLSADIIILPKKYMRYCKTDGLILTKEEIKRKGPLGIWPSKGKAPLKFEWSLSETSQKPWKE